MRELPDKIQWHPAFCAAAELELRENIKELDLIPEYNLSKEPIRIDLLVIKESEQERILKNEIGHIMRRHNVLEYKGPGDELSIDDLYKAIGYACLYKAYGKTVDEIPADEVTVSLFREAYPRELFKRLTGLGYLIERKYPGIYHVSGMQFPLQIVVIRQLARKTHSSLRILTDRADIEDIKEFLKNSEKVTDVRERSNIEAVLQVSVNANFELYEQVRRDSVMCEALRELMKEEIEIDKKKSREQGMAQGMAQVILNMYNNGFTLEQIILATSKSEKDIEDIIAGKNPMFETV